jgi:hypothetical protein
MLGWLTVALMVVGLVVFSFRTMQILTGPYVTGPFDDLISVAGLATFFAGLLLLVGHSLYSMF